MKLKCLIVDDEPRSHLVLEKYISLLSYTEMCGNCYDAIQAYHFIKDNKVDLMLLDINMPQVNGFSLLDMIEHKPMVIFTTAYSDYALKGYEYNAIDYLHKPIRFERFVQAIEKALKWQSIQPVSNVTSVEIKADGYIQLLAFDDINYIQSLGNYVKIFCTHKVIVTASTTKELEDKLPLPQFIRIHKSYIVNAAKISGANDTYISVNGIPLPIGKTFKKYIEEFISKRKV